MDPVTKASLHSLQQYMFLSFALGLLLVGKAAYDFWRSRRDLPEIRLMPIVWLIAACYLIGCSLKVWLVGPSWVRWYLSDFGFPVFIAVLAATSRPKARLQEGFLATYPVRHPWHKVDSPNWDPLPARRYLIRVTKLRYQIVMVMPLIGFIYEVFGKQFATSRGVVGTVGSFDPFDLVMYITATLIARFVLIRTRNELFDSLRDMERHERVMLGSRARRGTTTQPEGRSIRNR